MGLSDLGERVSSKALSNTRGPLHKGMSRCRGARIEEFQPQMNRMNADG
jgi:hypothetical protein